MCNFILFIVACFLGQLVYVLKQEMPIRCQIMGVFVWYLKISHVGTGLSASRNFSSLADMSLGTAQRHNIDYTTLGHTQSQNSSVVRVRKALTALAVRIQPNPIFSFKHLYNPFIFFYSVPSSDELRGKETSLSLSLSVFTTVLFVLRHSLRVRSALIGTH